MSHTTQDEAAAKLEASAKVDEPAEKVKASRPPSTPVAEGPGPSDTAYDDSGYAREAK